MILECPAATVKDDRKAEEYLAGWKLDTQARLAALEDAIFESTARQAELTERLRRLKKPPPPQRPNASPPFWKPQRRRNGLQG
ncbi:MAG: hypothetical protein ACLR0N_01160 [Bilophila wadsworthia]